MAYVFMDGFDKYGAPDTNAGQFSIFNLMVGDWTSRDNGTTIAVVAPLSLHGQAIKLGTTVGSTGLYRSIPAVSRVIGGFRFQDNAIATGGGDGISYFNGTTAAFSIIFNSAGRIEIRTGNIGGATLATSTVAIANFTTHYLEWDVTIGASSSYQVWLDGVLIFSGTGNTGNGQASVNKFAFMASGGASIFTVDDLYLFDSTGTRNNAALNTNPVVDTEFPASDSQTQWGFGASVIGWPFSYTTNTYSPGGNVLVLRPVTPAVACTLASIGAINTSTNGTAKFKGVVYSDTAGSPGTLLSSGTEVVGCTGGVELVLPLVTPQSLTAGTQVWIGYITDTAFNWYQSDNGTTVQQANNTYTSGAPGTAPAMTTGKANQYMVGNLSAITGSHDSYITDWNPPAQPTGNDLTYISDSVVGHEDLYAFGALAATPNTIYVAAVKAFCRNTDAGARTINLQTKSGATDSPGSNSAITPAQSLQWVQSAFETDPNTAAAWTQANLNAATSGPKINS